MATYIEYELDDGTILYIQGDDVEESGGVRRVSRGDDGNAVVQSTNTFRDALAGVKSSAKLLREQLNELKADEVEVTFGLKAIGEAGFFGISKVGMEANYEVKLKWDNTKKAE